MRITRCDRIGCLLSRLRLLSERFLDAFTVQGREEILIVGYEENGLPLCCGTLFSMSSQLIASPRKPTLPGGVPIGIRCRAFSTSADALLKTFAFPKRAAIIMAAFKLFDSMPAISSIKAA